MKQNAKTNKAWVEIRFLGIVLTTSLMLGTAMAQQQGQRPDGPPPQMDAATKAALEACMSSSDTALPARESGVRPTREQIEKFDACVVAKGGTVPKHRGPPPGGQPPREVSSTSENVGAQ